MRKSLISALVMASLTLTATQALAHAAITGTSIPNGGAVATAPPNYTVNYASPVRLAGVTLTNAAGQPVALNFRAASAPAARFGIALPRLAAGTYTMNLRAMGGDGHVMSNQLTFTIGAAAASAPKSAPMGAMPGMDHSSMGGMRVTASIADGAVLASSPRNIIIQFPHAMALTSARLTTTSGERVALQVPTSPAPTTSVTIAFPRLEADNYSFVWGANAGDHAMNGTVRFQVR